VESAKRTCERIIFKICHATPRAKKEGRRGEGGRGTTGTNGYRTVSPIVNGDSVFTRHEFYNSFTVTWLSEFRAPLKPPFPSSRPLLHLPPPPRWPDTRAGRYAYVRVALLVLFRGMHNARRGEFTLPMANRKSSANIRQETFFRLGRLSPFLEKCVDESPLCGSQGIAELPYPGATYSFISACICGWRFDCPRRRLGIDADEHRRRAMLPFVYAHAIACFNLVIKNRPCLNDICANTCTSLPLLAKSPRRYHPLPVCLPNARKYGNSHTGIIVFRACKGGNAGKRSEKNDSGSGTGSGVGLGRRRQGNE